MRPDDYDRMLDARSEARYEDDPMAERDDAWRETQTAREVERDSESR